MLTQFQPTRDSLLVSATVGEPSLQRGDAVLINATGDAIIGDAASFDNAKFVQGFVDDDAKTFGQPVSIRIGGVLKNAFAGFTPGARVYLKKGGVSGDTLAQVPPSEDEDVLLPVGWTLSATDLRIEVDSPIEV